MRMNNFENECFHFLKKKKRPKVANKKLIQQRLENENIVDKRDAKTTYDNVVKQQYQRHQPTSQ